MDAGIPIDLFWESSINEILDMMESRIRVESRKRREKIIDDFKIAEATAINIAILFSEKKNELSKPWDYYTDIFDNDKKYYEEQKRIRDLEEYKKQRQEYIKEFNRRRRQGM
ncbi:MAG: hypothetical protein Q4D16_19585 [Eubacteriales bacterium]|nr:hypothetical protein [Eubacteriales bacterium]